MAFVKLQPAAKSAPGSFKISTMQAGRGADAPWRIQVSIPSAEFHLTFGDVDRFDILMGEGPDAGKMLIQPGDGGGIQAYPAEKHSHLSPSGFGCNAADQVRRRKPGASQDIRRPRHRSAKLGLGAWTLAGHPRRACCCAEAGGCRTADPARCSRSGREA